ncbi:IspD/TarI family cytidylyltransferase [Hyphomicrobium facile]|uniref:IspD/TarI family cytidylyltransferase n=1 Tax=Hyphomicrobium facile TaxID=51670 RepID=UPI0015A62DF7|nr:2-C-methyl-D-erythritol 4-phosphate cytidylyltransferase [Hyphomicrobium facile]
MIVQALIQAAGSGVRLGLGPKAFVRLDDCTLLERAVRLANRVAASTIVAVPASEIERATALVGAEGVRIIPGCSSRSETTRRLIAEATAPWLLLHDVVHPFVDLDLVERLLGEAARSGAAAPGLPNSEFLYDRSGALLHGPEDVLIGQKPVVFSREAVLAGYAFSPASDGSSDPSLLDILERGGVRTTFVAGRSTNIKITTEDDLLLAKALIEREKA